MFRNVSRAGLVLALGAAFFGGLGVCRFVRSWNTNYAGYMDGGDYQGAGPTLSPDGQWVVYSSPRSGHGDLYEVRLDGTHARRLTDTPAGEDEPRFCADGRTVVYRRQWAGEEGLWTLDRTTLTRAPVPGAQGCGEPSLSPDGKLLACQQHTPGLNAIIVRLRILNLATGRPVSIPGVDGTDVVWDRADKRLYYVCGKNWDIHRANTDGSKDRIIGQGNCPTPSPDDTRVASLGAPNDQSIWIRNSDGARPICLYATRSFKEGLSFTPDGRRLIFLETTGRDEMRIALLDIRTRRATVVCSVL